jgi:hypothetical protein
LYCRRCGQQNSDQAQFCQRCGLAMGTVDAGRVSRAGRFLTRPYKSARVLALTLTVLFCIFILIALTAVVLDLFLIDLLSGGYVSSRDLQLNDNVQLAVRLLQCVVAVVTSVFVLVWIHRVHGNLPLLGARRLRYSPGWAVGGFLIPFVNYVLPFLVVREIWKASDPKRMDAQSWRDGPLSLLVPSWWVLLCVSVIAPPAVNLAFGGGDEVTASQHWNWVFLVSDVLVIPVAILWILVVRGIVSRQEKKHSGLVSAVPVTA